MDAFSVFSAAIGRVLFTQSNGTPIVGYSLIAGAAFNWINGSGVTNPLAGASVGKVYFSHADATAPRTMKAVIIN